MSALPGSLKFGNRNEELEGATHQFHLSRRSGPTWCSMVEEGGSARCVNYLVNALVETQRGTNRKYLDLRGGGRPRGAHGISPMHCDGRFLGALSGTYRAELFDRATDTSCWRWRR